MDAAPQGDAATELLAQLIEIRAHISTQEKADPHFGVFARRVLFELLKYADLVANAEMLLDALNAFDRSLIDGVAAFDRTARERSLRAIAVLDRQLRGTPH